MGIEVWRELGWRKKREGERGWVARARDSWLGGNGMEWRREGDEINSGQGSHFGQRFVTWFWLDFLDGIPASAKLKTFWG